jgi:CrcB protein
LGRRSGTPSAGVWLTPASLISHGAHWPVNVSGSLALGFSVGTSRHPTDAHVVFLLLTVGLCAGFTTFSTFTLDAFTLVERGEPVERASAYVLASVTGSRE